MGAADTSSEIKDVIDADGDKFDVLCELGRGGMGIVYKVRQHSFDRIVAIKMVQSAAFADQHMLMRLRREAMSAAQLHHPNIVKVHSIGMHLGAPFIVMEYIEGRTLSEMLTERNHLSASEAAGLFTQILDALEAIHGAGFVHRDIKPSNIIVTADGTAKLMDFGIAKQFTGGDEQRLTQTGAMLGSPSYMSPEQCAGGQVDPRSDIYSLGCTMFHALSGNEPFTADTALEVMFKHMHDQVDTLKDINNPVVANAVARAMEKDPNARFQSAAEFKQALTSGVPGTATRRKKKPKNHIHFRSPYLVAFATLLAVALIGGGWLCTSQHAVETGIPKEPRQALKPDLTSANAIREIEARLGERLQPAYIFGQPPPPVSPELRSTIKDIDEWIARSTTGRDDVSLSGLMVCKARAVGIYDEHQAVTLWNEALDFTDNKLGARGTSRDWETQLNHYVSALGYYQIHGMRAEFDKLFARGWKVIETHPPDSLRVHITKATFYRSEAALDYLEHNFALAEQYCRKAIAEQHIAGDDEINVQSTYSMLCTDLCEQLKNKEVLAIAKEQLPKSADFGSPHPPDIMYMNSARERIASYASLCALRLGKKELSDEYFEAALDARTKARISRDDCAAACIEHAISYTQFHDYASAYKWARRARELGASSFINSPAYIVWNLEYINIAQATSHFDETIDAAQKLIPVAENAGHLWVLHQLYSILGSSNYHLNHDDVAQSWLEKAKAVEPRITAPIDPRTWINVRRYEAMIAVRKQKFDDARAYFREAEAFISKHKAAANNAATPLLRKEYAAFAKAHGA
jgi:serine/threonine protein kinase/tetratricopeptide (TPR) repeat protein